MLQIKRSRSYQISGRENISAYYIDTLMSMTGRPQHQEAAVVLLCCLPAAVGPGRYQHVLKELPEDPFCTAMPLSMLLVVAGPRAADVKIKVFL
jgi:hypothetical protein